MDKIIQKAIEKSAVFTYWLLFFTVIGLMMFTCAALAYSFVVFSSGEIKKGFIALLIGIVAPFFGATIFHVIEPFKKNMDSK